MTPSTHVYHGPSATVAQVSSLLPDASCHPPVKHGDLLELRIRKGDRIVILDGVFQQAAPVRHKEICLALDAGAEVWGGASMGALRAAELDRFGMRGAGIVYRLFRTGALESDDEVALLHTEADEQSRPLTTALVSVRVLVRHLVRSGTLARHEADRILIAAQGLHFTERSWRLVLERALLSAPTMHAMTSLVSGPQLEWDVKARDAVRLLARLSRTPGTGPSPRRATATPVLVNTTHVERWRRDARPVDDRLAAAAALYCPDYPTLHRRLVLALLAESADPVQAALEDSERTLVRAGLGAIGVRQLVPHGCGSDETLHRVVRSFTWPGGLQPTQFIAAAVRLSAAAKQLHDAVSAAAVLNDNLASHGHPAGHSSRSTMVRHAHRRWLETDGTAPWDDHLASRGFADDADLYKRCAWFTPQLVLQPPETYTLALVPTSWSRP